MKKIILSLACIFVVVAAKAQLIDPKVEPEVTIEARYVDQADYLGTVLVTVNVKCNVLTRYQGVVSFFYNNNGGSVYQFSSYGSHSVTFSTYEFYNTDTYGDIQYDWNLSCRFEGTTLTESGTVTIPKANIGGGYTLNLEGLNFNFK